MQNSRMKAGETAQGTNKAWGIVALIGMVVVCTIGDNLLITAIGTTMFGFGAWKGGYMEETSQKLRNNLATPANAGERRAA